MNLNKIERLKNHFELYDLALRTVILLEEYERENVVNISDIQILKYQGESIRDILTTFEDKTYFEEENNILDLLKSNHEWMMNNIMENEEEDIEDKINKLIIQTYEIINFLKDLHIGQIKKIA